MIARVGGSRHDRVSSGCYRVLAIRAVAAYRARRSLGQCWRLCLASATPFRSGCGEECHQSAGEEHKQAKQNARIQEGRLTSAYLFHNACLLRAAPILGTVARESRDVFLLLLRNRTDAWEGLFRRGTSLSVAALRQAISPLATGVRPRALALRRSFSVIPATGGDSFHRATCASRRNPCGSRCFDRSARGRAS